MAFGNVNVPGRAHLAHTQAEAELAARLRAVESSSASHTHTPASIGAVPSTRKVNGKALSSDITDCIRRGGRVFRPYAHSGADGGRADVR